MLIALELSSNIPSRGLHGWKESNLRPAGLESAALASELHPYVVVALAPSTTKAPSGSFPVQGLRLKISELRSARAG